MKCQLLQRSDFETETRGLRSQNLQVRHFDMNFFIGECSEGSISPVVRTIIGSEGLGYE